MVFQRSYRLLLTSGRLGPVHTYSTTKNPSVGRVYYMRRYFFRPGRTFRSYAVDRWNRFLKSRLARRHFQRQNKRRIYRHRYGGRSVMVRGLKHGMFRDVWSSEAKPGSRSRRFWAGGRRAFIKSFF